MSTKNIAIILVGLVILAGVGYVGAKAVRQATREAVAPIQVENTVAVTSPTPVQTSEPVAAADQNQVAITATGFSPKTVTIKIGDSLTWMNNDNAAHNISSDPHPIHTNYPPLNLGKVAAGEQLSLTFDKAGTYTYHDHFNPSLKGTVVVE